VRHVYIIAAVDRPEFKAKSLPIHMCGIAGILAFEPNRDYSRAIRDMAAALRHRGPDGEGFHEDDPIWLGHRRLSIIDIAGGHQPINNEDGRYQLIHNGEIYNYKELVPELTAKGHVFQSQCDSEVIVHAYEEWGDDCVNHFNGMWAFAIWDSIDRRLFASRDRFGIKPFYYWMDGGRFIFASEIKGILAAGVEAEEDPRAIADYFAFLYLFGDKTFFRNIRQLEPGCSLTCDDRGKLSIRRYWRIGNNAADLPVDDAEAAEHLQALLSDAVAVRLQSDVPIGCYLSGGLDSSTVAAMAAANSTTPVKAFSAGFAEGGPYDEMPYARDVVRQSGLVGRELMPDVNGFWQGLPKVIWHLDHPFEGPQVYPKFRVSELAAREVKVCLSGQGGDEVFVGYPRYLMSYLEQHLQQFHHRDALSALRPWWGLTTWRSRLRFCRDLHRRFTLPERFLHFAAVQKGEDDWRRLFSNEFLRSLDGYTPFEEYHSQIRQAQDGDDLATLQRYEFGTFLQGLLHVEDRVSMAWGLENRLPLLDFRIAEFMVGLPPEQRTDRFQLKGLMKKSVAEFLPATVVERRDKLGFPTPFRDWAAGSLRREIADLLRDSFLVRKEIVNNCAVDRLLSRQSYTDMESLTLWALVATEIWERIFIEKIEPVPA